MDRGLVLMMIIEPEINIDVYAPDTSNLTVSMLRFLGCLVKLTFFADICDSWTSCLERW